VDLLAEDYANQPVVFLEHDADSPAPMRYDRWWAAFPGGALYLPLVMVDSGNRICNGLLDYYRVYEEMVLAELARPAQAEVLAYWWRTGDRANVSVQVTNLSGGVLGQANAASVHAMVYQNTAGRATHRFVRAAVMQSIGSLNVQETATFVLQTADLADVDWNQLQCVAAVDYRPGGPSGAYDMLQAALALPAGESLRVRPNTLTLEVGGDDAVGPTASVWVEAVAPVPWTASSNAAWLSVAPSAGTTTEQVTVAVNKDGLAPGLQDGVLTFTSGDGRHSRELSVHVTYAGLVRVYLPLLARLAY
jgi:hypothetical protein